MLTRPNKIAFEDSNIAGLGSSQDIKQRVDAAKSEKQWSDVGKAPGLEMWHIEQFKVRKLRAKDEIGKFYSGDSYIVLNTYKKDDKLMYDVHFWLGANTTQDEMGTAAYKTVELDDLLGGKPVQHREVQDNESQLFLSYFKPAMMILEGGSASGFNHVKAEEYKPRLLWIKGKKANKLRVREVPLSSKSLNEGDAFVLDCGLKIFQWCGPSAGVMEKRRAQELAQALNDQRGGKPVIVVLTPKEDNDAFWTALGGKGPIAPASAGGSDDEISVSNMKLYRLSDASGKLTFTLEQEGKPSKAKLNSNDVMLLDAGCEIFVWVGQHASKEERKMAMAYAGRYIKDNNKNPNTPVSSIMDGGENELFNSFF